MNQQKINPKKKTKWYFTWWGILSILVSIIVVISLIATWGQPVLAKVDSPTNQSKIEIKGTQAYANSKIEIYINNEKVKETTADKYGNFTSEIELKKEGKNKVKTTAINAKGKSKTSSEITVVYDITPPVLEVEKPESTTEQEKIEIKGKCEPRAEVKLLKDKEEIASVNTKNGEDFSFAGIELSEGENKFTVTAIDEAGNESKEKMIQIAYNKLQKVQEEGEEQLEEAPSPLEEIESVVKSIGDFEVTIWDKKGKLANKKTSPPYDVVVNSGPNQIESCFFAKNTLYEVMKSLYTNEATKDNIARVKFSAYGHLKASLGATDGRDLTWDSGPSNFWTVLLQYKPYEDESGPLKQRTYGVALGKCK